MPQRLILEAYHLSWNHIQRCEKWIHLSSSQVETKEKNYIGALGRELLPGLEKALHILRFHFFSFWQRVFTLVRRDPTIKRRWKEKHLILCAVSLWYGLPSLVFVLIKLNNHMKLTSFAVASPRQLTIEVLFHCPSFCSCRWPNTQRQKPAKFAVKQFADLILVSQHFHLCRDTVWCAVLTWWLSLPQSTRGL